MYSYMGQKQKIAFFGICSKIFRSKSIGISWNEILVSTWQRSKTVGFDVFQKTS